MAAVGGIEGVADDLGGERRIVVEPDFLHSEQALSPHLFDEQLREGTTVV